MPKYRYQKISGLQSLSRSLISIGNPLIAAAVYGMAGLDAVILLDLVSFAIAFAALALFIRIPTVRAGAGVLIDLWGSLSPDGDKLPQRSFVTDDTFRVTDVRARFLWN